MKPPSVRAAPSAAAEFVRQAAAAYGRGQWQTAELLCRQILDRHGPEFNALSLLGAIAARGGHTEKAVDILGQAAALRPDFAAAHNNHGIALKNLGRVDDALRAYRRALSIEPGFLEAHYNRGNALKDAGRYEQSIASYDAALALDSRYLGAHIGRGMALQGLGRSADALECFERALTIAPRSAEAHNNRGAALEGLGRTGEALDSYDRALAINADFVEALDSRGVLLRKLGRCGQALGSHSRVAALRPDYAGGHLNLAAALAGLGRHREALASCERAIALAPGDAGAHLNRGHALRALGDLDAALASHERALELDPRYVQAYPARASLLLALQLPEQALASYDRAIVLEPDDAPLHTDRGHALRMLRRWDEAVASYARALELDPSTPGLYGLWLHTTTSLCDWTDHAARVAALRTKIETAQHATPPFPVLSLLDEPALQRRAAELLVEHTFAHVRAAQAPTAAPWPPMAAPGPPERLPPCLPEEGRERIRVGYFSADFHDHATAQLLAEVIERHDRSRFDITAFSFGPDFQDEMRARLTRAFDRFLDVRARSDADIAALARDARIDIAVDLKGFTGDERHGIFAHRAAPLQVSYLGYPATMGAGYIDYLIADAVLIPERNRGHYAEKIVYLPDSYQPNDRARPLPAQVPSRADLGLPASGFVFCSFNNSYKITPAMFDVWMRILHRVEGSVLWLLELNATATANLRREAEARGIAGGRLVFAPRVQLPQHLARHRRADLFLDTLPCNAHTTASDALWTGLPLLTCAGESFASRVAASLLHAVGLPELVADSIDGYESLAVGLAADAPALARLREGLERARTTAPLFDTPRITRHLESAYTEMHERLRRGLAPDHIHVRREESLAQSS
jgi:predicted O-linked N-acetylglucosamine transferase (SPINDLY family)